MGSFLPFTSPSASALPLFDWVHLVVVLLDSNPRPPSSHPDPLRAIQHQPALSLLDTWCHSYTKNPFCWARAEPALRQQVKPALKTALSPLLNKTFNEDSSITRYVSSSWGETERKNPLQPWGQREERLSRKPLEKVTWRRRGRYHKEYTELQAVCFLELLQ